MRASLHTLGCRLNQAETALLANRLKRDGYQLVEPGQPTDLFVLNTCSVTEHAESDCRYLIRKTLRHSPDAFVAVTGCYAQTGIETLRRLPGLDLVVGTEYKMSLPDLLPPPDQLRKRPAAEVLHTRTIDRQAFTLPGAGEYETTRATLKVQDGCNFMCSFCIIPFARGHERSREFDDIVREAEELTARGHKELVLSGVNIGQYRHERRTLLDLIQRLEGIPGTVRVRISSIEPTTISEELLEYMATSAKLCRHLHIPLQSGDDGILKAMNRRYSVSEYAAFATKAVALVPGMSLGTDLMVGFPGEGEREFANTVAAATDLPFSYLHVFSFSKRPGTAAARLKSVHPGTIKARSRSLAELSRAKRLGFYQQHAGRTVTALFELGQTDGLWTGLTDNFIRVGTASRSPLSGEMRDVVITGVMDGLALGQLANAER